MAVTKTLRILLLGCLLQVVVAQRPWNDLRTTYSVLPSRGFHKIPKSTRDPLIKDYVLTKAVPEIDIPVNFYCLPNDPRACFMYDYKGNVAGVQISFLEQDISNVHPKVFDYGAKGYLKTNFMGVSAYSFRAFFTNPHTLTTDGRRNVNETVEGLWALLEGKIVEISRNEPSTPQEGFYKQSCFIGMGQHYFYKTQPKMACEDLSQSFFPLYEKGHLVGFGAVGFGKGSDGPTRTWYEKPPGVAVKMITPYRPCCLDDWVKKYGMYTMHVFFVDRPWTISCPARSFIDELKGLVSCL